jgi:formylglycine-generating enzyme required for sulfatase activity
MSDLDRYELFEQLGEDPYGKVVRARDHQAERWVAILQMHDRFRANPEVWDDVWSGIVRRANLPHEFITSVHDLLKSPGWIVCDLMKGDMAQVGAQGPVDPAVVRTALRRSLEALQWLHSQNEWHGAVRPANLQYDREGAVKLAFSAGFMLGGQIPHQGHNGKYLAPELLKPEFGAVGPGVDLYALGITALELLIGKKIDGLVKGTAAESFDPNLAWLRWHTNPDAHLPPTREIAPQAPSDVAKVIDRLIRKPVTERFGSANDALQCLDSAHPEKLVPVATSGAPTEPELPKPPPAPVAVHRPSPPAASSRPVTAARPRSWLQRKLDNPYVLTAVISVIVGLTAAVIWVQLQPDTVKPLTVESTPDGATIYVDGKKSEKLTNAELNLRVGKRKIRVEKANFVVDGELEQEIDLTLEKAPKKVAFKLVAEGKSPPGTGTNGSTDSSSVAGTDRVSLPTGLVAVGTETDPTLKLPLKARADKLAEGAQALEFVLISAGQFIYGADEPLQPGELPRRTAEIAAAFYAATTEVSRRQWDAFSAAAPGAKPASGDAGSQSPSPDHPMTGISFQDAKKFCKWVSPGGRLPTEKEWERVARGTEGRLYPWLSGGPTADVCNASLGTEELRPMAACRSFEKGGTPEGILHLLGNAAEWCDDVYEPGFEDEAITGGGVDHAIRGASILERSPERLRATWRANLRLEGALDVGFRVVVPVK